MLGTLFPRFLLPSSSHPQQCAEVIKEMFVIVWSRVKVERITAMMSRRRRNRQTKLLHDSLVSCSSRLFSVLIYFTILLNENRTFQPTCGCYWPTAVLEGRRKDFSELYMHTRQWHVPQGCVSVIVPRVVVICSSIEAEISSCPNPKSKSYVG